MDAMSGLFNLLPSSMISVLPKGLSPPNPRMSIIACAAFPL